MKDPLVDNADDGRFNERQLGIVVMVNNGGSSVRGLRSTSLASRDAIAKTPPLLLEESLFGADNGRVWLIEP